MQGDFYRQGDRALLGMRQFDMPKLLAEQPDYVVFNGHVVAVGSPLVSVAAAAQFQRCEMDHNWDHNWNDMRRQQTGPGGPILISSKPVRTRLRMPGRQGRPGFESPMLHPEIKFKSLSHLGQLRPDNASTVCRRMAGF
jgi:hypothetical protein